jgi:hypothetical protein
MTGKIFPRILLAILALNGLTLGIWATVSPRNFYDDFPGFDRHWVAMDGPFNEHLMRDFGALNLALSVVAVCAFVWLTRPLVIATALAWLTWCIPHLVYHATHLDGYDTGDQTGIMGALIVVPVIAVLLLFAAGRLVDRPTGAT